jgi:hypothetical protein
MMNMCTFAHHIDCSSDIGVACLADAFDFFRTVIEGADRVAAAATIVYLAGI